MDGWIQEKAISRTSESIFLLLECFQIWFGMIKKLVGFSRYPFFPPPSKWIVFDQNLNGVCFVLQMKKSRENLPTTTVAKVQVKVLEFQAQEDHPTLHLVKIQLDLLKEGKDLMTVDQVPWLIFLCPASIYRQSPIFFIAHYNNFLAT